jgi:hypothetical protein
MMALGFWNGAPEVKAAGLAIILGFLLRLAWQLR